MRKYRDVKIATTKERFNKLIAKPTLKQWQRYEENLTAVQLRRSCVDLNKPRYIGMAILDLSKLIMYNFHYNYINKEFPGTKLLFTDTGKNKLKLCRSK